MDYTALDQFDPLRPREARWGCEELSDKAASPRTLIGSQAHPGSELLSAKSDTSRVCRGSVPIWWLNRNDSTSPPTAGLS